MFWITLVISITTYYLAASLVDLGESLQTNGTAIEISFAEGKPCILLEVLEGALVHNVVGRHRG